MAVTLLIALWALNEYSYDRFLSEYEQAYHLKVNMTSRHDGTTTQDAICLPRSLHCLSRSVCVVKDLPANSSLKFSFLLPSLLWSKHRTG